MTKVAIYARYSSDNQNAASTADQFRICHERAGQEQWAVSGTYHDAAISGASDFVASLSVRPEAFRVVRIG